MYKNITNATRPHIASSALSPLFKRILLSINFSFLPTPQAILPICTINIPEQQFHSLGVCYGKYVIVLSRFCTFK